MVILEQALILNYEGHEQVYNFFEGSLIYSLKKLIPLFVEKDQLKLLASFYKIKNIKSLNKKINSLFGNLMIGLEFILNRSGPMTMGASQLC